MPLELEIRGAIILSHHNGWQPFVGSVGIEGGRIATVSPTSLGASGEKVVDAAGKVLMPGLVNGHCHGDMTLARGLGDDLTLGEQNEAFADTGWFYSLISDEDRLASRKLTYCEALLSGTTFIMENMYWSLGAASAKAMAECGIHGALAEDIRVDFSKPDIFLTKAQRDEFRQSCVEHGFIPVLGSLSEEDFTEERLKAVQRIAEEECTLITAHLAETDWRLAMVQERYGCGPVEYLAGCGALTPRLLASHMVHPTPEEIALLARAGTPVINTPLCEAKIADGIAPIPQMLKAGVTVALGTDGAMWNNSNDLFREMKGMALLHTAIGGIRTLSARDVLDMATINGARAFGLEDEMGTVEAGKRADLILVDTRAPHLTPLRTSHRENVASSMVYCATGADVSDVFVGGRHLVQNRRLATVDLPALCGQVNEISARLAKALDA